MNTERIKSFVLFFLVITSFVLTTRIWFYISIEGLFVMTANNKTTQTDLSFKKDSLLKPSKLVVHTGQSHRLLFNNEENKEHYGLIMEGSVDALRNWIGNKEDYSSSTIPKTQLSQIRSTSAVELIFEYDMQLENIKSLLSMEQDAWKEVTDIDSILIVPNEKKVYVIDEDKSSIYQFTASNVFDKLRGAIAEVEKKNDFDYVFLNEFNKEGLELYGDYAIAPVSILQMPVPVLRREFKADTDAVPEVARFFDDAIDNISSTKNNVGEITFTDREEETVTIDDKGALEYYKFNMGSKDIRNTEIKEAIDIAARYVNRHIGFTYDFYLSNVKRQMQGVRASYIISFDYKYKGMPVISESGASIGAIEVEILGQEVIRYKRNVKVIEDQGKRVNIKSFQDILDIVWGYLDNFLYTNKSESIILLKDMYLAYFESNETLVPVWVIEVLVEGKDGDQYDKKFIIDAEEGMTLYEEEGRD